MNQDATTTTSGGTLGYDWEQNDIGSVNNNLATDPGNGPIIRSLNPTPTGVRTIPRLSNLVAGTALKGEILPTTARTLHFRLTVRDNVPNSGSTSSADMTVQSVVTSGAFKVNTPGSAVNWAGNSSQSVTWDVAGTTAAPIACAQVGISAASFWAAVPYYVAQPPCPKATLALLRKGEDVLDVAVPLGDLPEEARAWQDGVDELAAEDQEVADYVRSLEEAKDTTELPEAVNNPLKVIATSPFFQWEVAMSAAYFPIGI